MGVLIAFLRGINVGGHRKIRMADLKQVHAGMGHTKVVTYLQSGNVIFECDESARPVLIREIEDAYESNLGVRPTVILRSPAELRVTAAACPFSLTPHREAKFLHAVLLSGRPAPEAVESLLAHDGPEEKQVVNNALYIYYTQGSGNTKLTLPLIERRLGVNGTARNWNTVTKLLELTNPQAGAQS